MYTSTLAASLFALGAVNAAPHRSTFPKYGLAKRAAGVGDGTTVLGFWGQSFEDLSDVCSSGDWDVVILSFITSLNPPKLNMGKDTGSPSEAQSAQSGWELFDGTVAGANGQSLADQITGCQGNGVKVMIAFGGDSRYCNSTFTSSAEAVQSADYVWDLFLGGTGSEELRPFGADVVLDGLDIDNEADDGSFYLDFVKELRGKMGNGTDKAYYMAADPMAANVGPFADDSMTAIPDSILPYLDWVNVQFYNAGEQGVGGSAFRDTFEAWAQKLEAVSPTPKLFLGVPGAEGAAGDGVQTPDEIKETVATVQGWGVADFGGVGIWDCGYADMNNTGFAAAVKSSLTGVATSSSSANLTTAATATASGSAAIKH